MAVTIDATGALFVTPAAVTSVDYGPTGGNAGITTTAGATAIIVLVAFSGAAFPTSVTVTWDSAGVNQTMSPIASATGTIIGVNHHDQATLYGLTSPSSSGNKNIHLAWTGSNAAYINAVSFAGTDTVNAFINGANTNGSTTTPSVTVSTVNNSIAIGVASIDSDTINSVGQTIVFNDSTGPDGNGFGNRTAGAGSNVSLSGVLAGTGGWAYAGVDVQPSAGAASSSTLPLMGVG